MTGFKLPVSVLVVVHTADLRVLLIERADRPGFWQSVTGSSHEGETLRETALREVQEETGIDASLHCLADWQVQNRFQIFNHWRHRYAPGVTHNTEHVFGLALPDAVPVRLSPREHTDWQWLHWEAALQKVFSWSNADAIRMLPTRGAGATRFDAGTRDAPGDSA